MEFFKNFFSKIKNFHLDQFYINELHHNLLDSFYNLFRV